MTTRVTLLGAVDEVTGSCTLLDTGDARMLVDLGMIQGDAAAATRNETLPDVDLRWVNAVTLTHVHLDHCGRLPMLVRQGWRGPVYCSEPTADLLPMVLKGSARVQRLKAQEWVDLKDRDVDVPGDSPPPLLFDEREVDALLNMVVPLRWHEHADLPGGTRFHLQPAGHILGAASVALKTPDARVVFSGDLGRTDLLPVVNPTPCPAADLVVIESTYGDTAEPGVTDVDGALAAVLVRAQGRGGPVIVPTFAIGRCQQLLHALGRLSRKGQLGMNVYLDAPMAARVTDVHAAWPQSLHPAAMPGVDDELDFPERFTLRSKRAAKRLRDVAGPAVILAGHGFGEGGPILRHFQRWLPDPAATVLLTGHCLAGTLVGHLATDPPWAWVHGRRVPVEAHIEHIDAFGGHALTDELAAWLQPGAADATVVVNHGEAAARAALAARLEADGLTVSRPALGEPVMVTA